MNAHIGKPAWDGVERRSSNSCRRKNPDRRSNKERRHDPRSSSGKRRGIRSMIRSLFYNRLGVDRRKGVDRRIYDRRSSTSHSLLSKEELHDLLKK